MNELQTTTIEEISKVKDGFKPIRDKANVYASEHTTTDVLAFAYALYESEVYQARMMATILFGGLAAKQPEVLAFLRERVSRDADWRVQEMLAMAFDTFCKAIGYEEALPIIKSWLADEYYAVRRAVSEGLRIWTYRDYFKQHPEVAVELLSGLKEDEHEYVRKSAGNALRDISRFHKELVRIEVTSWDKTDKRIADTYSYAAKFL